MRWLHLIGTPEDVRDLVCGSPRVDWTAQELSRHVVASHGYSHSDAPVRWFVAALVDMTQAERASFLQFATGQPVLPREGSPGLSSTTDDHSQDGWYQRWAKSEELKRRATPTGSVRPALAQLLDVFPSSKGVSCRFIGLRETFTGFFLRSRATCRSSYLRTAARPCCARRFAMLSPCRQVSLI